MSFEVWLTFFAASWLISLSPGPGAVYAMSCGMNHGFWRGYAGTVGLIAGILTLLAVVSVGLGALLTASVTAFQFVKWCGVAYLVYIGVQQWRSAARRIEGPGAKARLPARTLVARGWALNATNPKGALFMLAVVPQFVDPTTPLAPQYLLIATTLAFTDVVVMAGYTMFAAKVLAALRDPRHLIALNRLFGGLFVGAAFLLATWRRSS
jgi:homoserine/homoserine lactone efflux protein